MSVRMKATHLLVHPLSQCGHGRLYPVILAGNDVRKFSTTRPVHQDSGYQMLVVGGGTAGSSIASKFASRLGKGKVAVIEPSETHYYQPLFTLVGGGLKTFEQSHRPTGDVLPRNADWIRDSAGAFDPEGCTVMLQSGKLIKYDYLVIAMGLELHYEKVKGLPEALKVDPRVCSNYDPTFVQKTLPAIENFGGGDALFTMPAGPIKCAGAPQKICYLFEDYLTRNGKRSLANSITYNTALPAIFAVPRYANSLMEVAKSRNIGVNFKHNLIEVRHKTSEAIFEILDSDGKTATFKYDLLHASPPCQPPAALQGSHLVDKAGFVDVHSGTMQHIKYKNVFSLGDCSNSPTSKTAAAISGQSAAIDTNLAAVIEGKEPTRHYDGYTSCPLVVSNKECILAEFGYDQKILETFPIDQAKPSWLMYPVKADIMPIIYWQLLVKGLWHGPKFYRKLFSMWTKD